MTLQDWGATGEVVGALAVVITLIYLAKQIRQNTHAMEEGRRLALVQAADSEYIGPIIIKLTELGYPQDVKALEQLSYYDDAFKGRVVRLAPTWRALGLTTGRRSFFAEIDRLSRE